MKEDCAFRKQQTSLESKNVLLDINNGVHGFRRQS